MKRFGIEIFGDSRRIFEIGLIYMKDAEIVGNKSNGILLQNVMIQIYNGSILNNCSYAVHLQTEEQKILLKIEMDDVSRQINGNVGG